VGDRAQYRRVTDARRHKVLATSSSRVPTPRPEMEKAERETAIRPYLHIDQLAAVTPWSEAAIRTMIARGEFKLGTHYFKPGGPRSRPIFKWTAVCELIEAGVKGAAGQGQVRLADGTVVDLDAAEEDIHALRR